MLIGISGKKQVGKSTSGIILDYIYKYAGEDPAFLSPYVKEEVIKRIYHTEHCPHYIKSFANILKLMAANLCNVNRYDYEDGKFKSEIDPTTGLTHREVLQKIGESIRNTFGEDIWIKALFNEGYDPKHDTWIITDVRYRNEADYIKDKGGILIRINRNTGYNDNHKSETDLDDYDKFDYIVDNNGTINQLIDKMVDIYNDLLKK